MAAAPARAIKSPSSAFVPAALSASATTALPAKASQDRGPGPAGQPYPRNNAEAAATEENTSVSTSTTAEAMGVTAKPKISREVDAQKQAAGKAQQHVPPGQGFVGSRLVPPVPGPPSAPPRRPAGTAPGSRDVRRGAHRTGPADRASPAAPSQADQPLHAPPPPFGCTPHSISRGVEPAVTSRCRMSRDDAVPAAGRPGSGPTHPVFAFRRGYRPPAGTAGSPVCRPGRRPAGHTAPSGGGAGLPRFPAGAGPSRKSHGHRRSERRKLFRRKEMFSSTISRVSSVTWKGWASQRQSPSRNALRSSSCCSWRQAAVLAHAHRDRPDHIQALHAPPSSGALSAQAWRRLKNRPT